MLMRKPVFIFTLACLLAAYPALATDPQVTRQDAQISVLQDELAVLRKRHGDLLGSLKPLQNKVAALEAVLGNQEQVANDTARQVGQLQRQLLKLDKEIARLTAPCDPSVAWKAYDSASAASKPIAFRALFNEARGREPNNEEMANFRVEAKILEIEIRKKAIVPVGLALARIGNTLVEFPKFVAGLIASVESKSLEIVNNINSATQAMKSLLDGVAGDPELAGRLKPLLTGATASLNRLYGESNDPINKVLGLADEVKAKAQAMADDSYKQFKESVYGTVDPTSARKQAERDRGELLARFEKLRASLGELDQRRAPVESALASLRQAVAEVRGDVRKVDAAIAAAEGKLEVAEDLKADLQFQAERAAIQLQPLLRGVSLWVSRPRHQQELHLAVDDVSAHTLRLPRAGSYSLDLRMSQHGQVGCLYDCKSSRDGSRMVCSRSTLDVVWEAPNLTRFEGVVPLLEGRGVTLDAEKQQIVATEPGEAVVIAPQPQGVVGYQSSRHPQYDKRPTHGSEMRDQAIQIACDSNVKPVLGPITETYGRYPVVTHQVKEMHLLRVRPPLPGQRDARRAPVPAGQVIDLFHSANPGIQQYEGR